nr:MAG TPA: hypothetical protein [Caudoviricetes sp.]
MFSSCLTTIVSYFLLFSFLTVLIAVRGRYVCMSLSRV